MINFFIIHFSLAHFGTFFIIRYDSILDLIIFNIYVLKIVSMNTHTQNEDFLLN